MTSVTQQIPVWALVLGLVVCLSLSAAQEGNLNPGLWELKTSLTSPDRPAMSAPLSKMQEALKKMPPEARRALEQKMAAQGLGFGDSGDIRVCFTEEQVRRDLIFPGKSGNMAEDCTYSNIVRTGNTLKGQMRCVNPPMTGDFQAVISSTRYTTEANVVSAERGQLHMKTEAQWLGSDCGSIKPQ